MYGKSNFAFQNPVGVHSTARYPGELGQYVWAPRGTIEGVLQCPSVPRLASEPVMNLETRGANDINSNEQQLKIYTPDSFNVRTHHQVARNQYPGQTKPSAIHPQPSRTYTGTEFNTTLFATPTAMQENLISTGILSNPYTGQEYEIFENQLPPGTTDRSLSKSQLNNINPRLVQLQGGLNHHNPPASKIEQDGSVFKPVSIVGGSNPFGPQLYTKQINDRQMDIIARSTYNNRGGDQVIEPAFAKERPANRYGYVPIIRQLPYLVPTNQIEGHYISPPAVTNVDTRKREQYTGIHFNTKPRVHVKNRVFPHEGPEGTIVVGESDRILPHRDGTHAMMAGPGLSIGSHQSPTCILNPAQPLCALPVGMVTGTPLPNVRMTEHRSTSQGLLPSLPTAPVSNASAHMVHGIANPSLRTPSYILPQAPITGKPAPAEVPVISGRPGPQTTEPLPAGQISVAQAQTAIPTNTMREGPQSIGSLPPGLPTMQPGSVAVPTETMRVGPQSIGSLPPGLPTMQPGSVAVPTETMRAGPQGIGALPTALPTGQIAPAVIPTTLTTLSNSLGPFPGALPTGVSAQRVNPECKDITLRRPELTLPGGQASAENMGGNVSSTMEMRELGNKVRLFGHSHTANPAAGNIGEVVHGYHHEPLTWRGEHESDYQIGEFSNVIDGAVGPKAPDPVFAPSRKLPEFTPHQNRGDYAIDRPLVALISTVNERTLREEQICQQMADDI